MTIALLLIAGIVLLLGGGELLVRGAVGVANRAGLPPLVIGLTLVGFGTSMPELLASLQGALAGAPGIAVGNVVGSNVANILLILGVAALIAPIAVDRAAFRRDGLALALATAAGVALVLTGAIGRPGAAALLLGLGVYLWTTLRSPDPAQAEILREEAASLPAAPPRLAVSLGFFAVGLALLLLGARWLVTGAVDLAEAAGLSETVIGLTVVAIGTSLPELVTSAAAARRGESGVALGNVIGSNVFNILGILGVTALVVPLEVPAEVIARDLWVMVAATVLLVAAAVTGWRVTRAEGVGLVALYALYLVVLVALA